MTAMKKQRKQLPSQPPVAPRDASSIQDFELLAPEGANDVDGSPSGPKGHPPSPAAPGAHAPAPIPAMILAVGRQAKLFVEQPMKQTLPVAAANDSWASEVVSLKGSGESKTNLVIIGGGPACISALEELLQAKPSVRNALEVYIVDDATQEQLGRGVPFRRAPGVASDFLFMNMFTESVQLNKQARIVHGLVADLSTVPMCDFMKRCHVGDALASRAVRVMGEAAAARLPVIFMQGRAFDLSPGRDATVNVHVRNVKGEKTVIAAQAVIMTIGNESGSRYEKLRGVGFIDAPWSETKGIHLIPNSARVAIAGTSLAAMDSASVLQAQHHQGPLFMFSPSAKLPGIRPLHASTQLKVLAPERLGTMLANESLPLSLDAVLRLVKLEFQAHGQNWALIQQRLKDYNEMKPLDFLIRDSRYTGQVNALWGVQKALDDVIALLWREMAPQARRFVLSKLATFAALQWSAAPPTAHRVMAMLHTGQLTLAEAGDARRSTQGGFEVICKDGSKIEVDFLVDASGFAGRLEEFRDPLIQAMCRRRLLTPDESGLGAKVCFADGRLLDAGGEPTGPIWAGACALTRGTYLLSNELGEATHSAARSARAAASYLDALARRQAD